MYLLDTNVISEFRRKKPHGAVLAWVRGIRDSDLNIAAVTLGELQAGVELTRRNDPEKASEIEAWIESIAETYNIVPVDGAIFRRWARITHGQSDDLIGDAMIAATAKVHNLIVVTRNVKDFSPFDVETVNPFVNA